MFIFAVRKNNIYVTEEQFKKLVNLMNEDINSGFAVDPEKWN